MTDTPVNLCKNCRHFVPGKSGWFVDPWDRRPLCGAVVEVVMGEPDTDCRNARMSHRECGPEGKLFEPRT